MVEGYERRDVELGMPTGGAFVEGQAKFRDFGTMGFDFREPLRHMVHIPNVEERLGVSLLIRFTAIMGIREGRSGVRISSEAVISRLSQVW